MCIRDRSGVEQVILMLLDLMRGNGPDDDEVPEWLVYNSLTDVYKRQVLTRG